jgi:hypothetical protein
MMPRQLILLGVLHFLDLLLFLAMEIFVFQCFFTFFPGVCHKAPH